MRRSSPIDASTHPADHLRGRPCLLVDMQGFLVVLVPVFIAGFALLMDHFENRILAEPGTHPAAEDPTG